MIKIKISRASIYQYLLLLFPLYRAGVPTVFKCPYCNNEKSVECKLDMKTKIGDVTCRICASSYQTTITCNTEYVISSFIPSHSLILIIDLSDPVDVFHEWVDAFEAANAPVS